MTAALVDSLAELIHASASSTVSSPLVGRYFRNHNANARLLIPLQLASAKPAIFGGNSMGKLIYLALTSLDGYIEDVDGDFSWAMPDADVHQFVNDFTRPVKTHLYGRRMYETMAVWETLGDEPDASPVERDYAKVWRGSDKVVFSTTLDAVSTSRTRLIREFDASEVESMKSAVDHDLSVSGPGLAQHAFRAGLVDEVCLFLSPVIVGGGRPGLPAGLHVDLDLVDERRFDNGVVFVRYHVGR